MSCQAAYIQKTNTHTSSICLMKTFPATKQCVLQATGSSEWWLHTSFTVRDQRHQQNSVSPPPARPWLSCQTQNEMRGQPQASSYYNKSSNLFCPNYIMLIVYCGSVSPLMIMFSWQKKVISSDVYFTPFVWENSDAPFALGLPPPSLLPPNTKCHRSWFFSLNCCRVSQKSIWTASERVTGLL